MSSETANESLPADAHSKAAEVFVERARSTHGEKIVELYVFGSTIRGEASGRSSDVDVLLVLPDTPDYDVVAGSLRDIAYDVMLEYGPVIELHLLNETTFERHQREENLSSEASSARGTRMPDDDPDKRTRTNCGSIKLCHHQSLLLY
jgi:predicted nucleotidyltransferase